MTIKLQVSTENREELIKYIEFIVSPGQSDCRGTPEEIATLIIKIISKS